MAELEIKEGKVVTTVEPSTYTLTLNEDEYLGLMLLVGKVGGNPEGTIRELTDSLWKSVFEKKFIEELINGTGESNFAKKYIKYRKTFQTTTNQKENN